MGVHPLSVQLSWHCQQAAHKLEQRWPEAQANALLTCMPAQSEHSWLLHSELSCSQLLS